MPFSAPQILDGMTLRDRNDVRRNIRDRVGQHVYMARRPAQSDSVHTAITIRPISADATMPLLGEIDMPMEMLQVDVWSRGPDADWRAYITGKLVRMAVNGYWGLWGTSQITGCVVRRQTMLANSPVDGTDDWPFRYSLDLEVMHYESAAIYPVASLVARIETWVRN